MHSVWCHYISLISLRFLGYDEHWDFVGNPYGIPLDRVTCLHLRLNIKYISTTWACTMLTLTASFLFDFVRVATFDIALTLTLRGCDLEYFTPYYQFLLLISKLLDILIQQRLTLSDIWFFMASLIPQIEYPLVLLHHIWFLDVKTRLLFSDAWLIVAKYLLILFNYHLVSHNTSYFS
jgi:hypothetical protein